VLALALLVTVGASFLRPKVEAGAAAPVAAGSRDSLRIYGAIVKWVGVCIGVTALMAVFWMDHEMAIVVATTGVFFALVMHATGTVITALGPASPNVTIVPSNDALKRNAEARKPASDVAMSPPHKSDVPTAPASKFDVPTPALRKTGEPSQPSTDLALVPAPKKPGNAGQPAPNASNDSPKKSAEAIKLAIGLALDAGEYERAAELIELVRRTAKPASARADGHGAVDGAV
jgi:hypothetical protein